MASSSAATSSTPSTTITYLSFSEEHASFSVGFAHGFRTYNLESAAVINRGPKYNIGAGAIVETLGISQFNAVVGDGTVGAYPRNKLFIWDEHTYAFIAELEFRNDILGLRVRKDRMVVVTESKIHVYAFAGTPEHICTIETGPNPSGLASLSPVGNALLAFLSLQEGCIQLVDLDGAQAEQRISAHTNAISCLTFNHSGSLLATASTKGTCLRVFNTTTAQLVRELRRGVEASDIRCMAFSSDSKRLVVCSDKKTHATIHVFALQDDDLHHHHPRLFGLESLLPQAWSSEWSFARFQIADVTYCICRFAPANPDVIKVVTAQGMLHTLVIDAKEASKCREKSHVTFVPDHTHKTA